MKDQKNTAKQETFRIPSERLRTGEAKPSVRGGCRLRRRNLRKHLEAMMSDS